MKKFILVVLITAAISSNMYAQDVKSESFKQFMQITTVESVVAGGLGRSKMITPNNHLLFVKNGKKVFVNRAYESKNNRWKMAFRAGKEVVQPARAFVQQWLGEIK
jgi:hypothetical protein